MNIFIAGSWNRREELRSRAWQLESLGHTVTSRWLVQGPRIGMEKASLKDVEDVLRSDCVLVQLEDSSAGYLTGGRWVEMGIGIANGARVIVVGRPIKENVHCHFPGNGNGLLPVEHYETWEEVYQNLPVPELV